MEFGRVFFYCSSLNKSSSEPNDINMAYTAQWRLFVRRRDKSV